MSLASGVTLLIEGESEMPKSLALETVDAYAKSGCTICPFCGSTNISGGAPSMSGREITVDVTCNSCDKEWRDLYSFVSLHDGEWEYLVN